MAEKIIGIYKITNTVTGKFYIGSSKNVKKRWAVHKCPSTWKSYPNNLMYIDMKKYGVDKFSFQILEEVEPEELKVAEQQFIETLNPTYNSNRANGRDIERYKEYQIEYQIEYYQQNREKLREHKREYYQQNCEKLKEHQIEYYQQNREKLKEHKNKYNNQLCCYNGETLTLNALSQRFSKAGIEHPQSEAKKYLLNK